MQAAARPPNTSGRTAGGTYAWGPQAVATPPRRRRRQVFTVERFSGTAALVGSALLPVFLDPREGSQPTSRSVRDYVLNQVRSADVFV